MKKIFILLVCLLIQGCQMESTPAPRSTYTSIYDRPIDNTEMLCERLPVNNIISDNVACMEARVGDRKGDFYKTYNEVVIIPSVSLFVAEVHDKELTNPNEIRDVAFKSCAIKMFKSQALHKKAYCECIADVSNQKLQNKKKVTGKDVIYLWGDKTSSKTKSKDKTIHELCENKLDPYLTYDSNYEAFFDDCIKEGKKTKKECDVSTQVILESLNITKTKGVYKSDLEQEMGTEAMQTRVHNVLEKLSAEDLQIIENKKL